MFNPWIHLSKNQMLQLLIIISVCIFGVQTYEVSDEKYSLSTTGSPEYVNSLEDAQNKCVDSWLLEIYDENVATLLKKLNVNIQVNGILLGMKIGTNTWRWSDGTNFVGNINDQSESTRFVACIGRSNNQVQFFARTVFDSAAVICSRISTKDKCSEWFYNGLCYFKPTTANYKWFEAHNECIRNDATMATFNNSETNFNTSFIDNQKYWVSLSRATWVWTHAVQTSEVSYEKYFLSTTGSPEYVNSLEDAQNKCVDSWLLEIYDENVATLLKKLNVNIQVNGILLGMKRGTNTWMWSDGTEFKGNINDQSESTRFVACIEIIKNQVEFFARTVFDSAAVICSRISTKDKCSEWFHNGLCYFKATTANFKWFEAHNVCIKNGASMATFNNSETNFNMSFIGNQQYWVSLSRSTWVWNHAGEAVTFNKWSNDQPAIYDYQRCATTNTIGNEWRIVDCVGKYHIVCMRENPKSTTTQPSSSPGTNNNNNIVVTTSKYRTFEDSYNHEVTIETSLPVPRDNDGIINATKPANEESLSSGAKAGIGVGVSMLLIIIIIIVGVLVFKYVPHLKGTFRRKNSRKPLERENHYAEIVPGNDYTASTDNNPKPINYADLNLQARSTSVNDI